MSNIVFEVSDADFQREVEHEEAMRSRGIEAYRKALSKARDKGRPSATAGATMLLKSLIEPSVAAFDAWMSKPSPGAHARAKDLLRSLPSDTCVYIALKVMIDGLVEKRVERDVLLKIGRLIEDEVRFRHFKSIDRKAAGYAEADLKKRTSHQKHARAAMVHAMGKANIEWEGWTDDERLRVGVKVINIIAKATGVVSREVVRRKRRTKSYLTLSEDALALLDDFHGLAETLSPPLLPTLIPPKPWESPWGGGYWTEAIPRRPLVKTRHREYLKNLEDVDMPEVYTAINLAQATPWSVNQQILDTARWFWERSIEIAGLPRREYREVPQKPHDIDTNDEARKSYRIEAAKVHNWNRETTSHRVQATSILGTAQQMRAEKRFWFPYQYDFRGRLYPIPVFLTPQGCDLAKGLLQFADGKPLGPDGGGWLAVHGANSFGFDKVSFEDRVQWVLDHEGDIMKCGINPLDNRWWADADDPWQFLAFCFEWVKFQAKGEGHVSHLPVHVDGSCNGLQHLSALGRDERGGAAVNLVPAERPRDIYSEVADELVASLLSGHAQRADSLKAVRWRPIIDRKVCKRPTMTYPYGCVAYGVRAMILEDTLRPLRDLGQSPFAPEDELPAAIFLADHMLTAIRMVVTSAAEVMEWLQGVAGKLAAEELPVIWTTPDGFPVLQDYRKMKSRRVDTTLMGSLVRFRLANEDDALNVSRMRAGIAPNITHSLDACHMRAVINAVGALTDDGSLPYLGLVHDSFGTLACDVPVLGTLLREAFVRMYTPDVLEELADELKARLPADVREKIPPTPERGSLDLEQVRESPFFFA